jgi:GAF domain-containing protein
MVKELITKEGSREEKYSALLPQIEALTEGEGDLIANMANIAAALRETFGFFWVGFYIVKGFKLVLGPFQGSIACTRIAYGKGVCGHAWKTADTVIVPDVELFEGYISCNDAACSEIVVPVMLDGKVVAVLDVDSDREGDFDETDAYWLNKITQLLYR